MDAGKIRGFLQSNAWEVTRHGDMEMIEIENQRYTRDWLLGTVEGQHLLMDAKSKSLRPACQCCDEKPKLYIAMRGTLYYLCRMPGTANLHAQDCESHIVPRHVYADALQSPADILAELWAKTNLSRIPDGSKNWASVRGALYLAAGKISVDGETLSTRLMIPRTFAQEKAKDIENACEQFYAQTNDDDGASRYWTLGIIKSMAPTKFNTRMVVKHLPFLNFWVPEEMIAALPEPTGDQLLIALICGRQSKAGIVVRDIAGILTTPSFVRISPVSRPPHEQNKQEKCGEDKLSCVAKMLGLPPKTHRRVVLEALVDHFLKEPHCNDREQPCPKADTFEQNGSSRCPCASKINIDV